MLPGHVVCDQCQAAFPKRWLDTPHISGAVRKGTLKFCCVKCNNTFVNITAPYILGRPFKLAKLAI